MTAKKKKKPRKRSAPAASSLSTSLRRLGTWCLISATIAIQTTSCGFAPATAPSHPRTGHAGSSAASASSTTHFRDCPQFFAGGVAPVVSQAPHLRELCYDAFAILHSGSTRTPVFVAERLNRKLVQQAQGELRTDRFFADARLPRSERAELADYKGSGYARGHMAPAGDMPTPAAMAQSFSLANMVPQDPKQNSGPWAKIEQDTRRYAMRAKSNVYVITGPVFGLDRHVIGARQVRVPTHLFKLVYDATTKRAWAYWQQNSPYAQVDSPISYRDLKQRIGMELLPGVEIR
ncbi:MAG: DNA/RNA non-specific endonuclease [Acidovorax sp.]